MAKGLWMSTVDSRLTARSIKMGNPEFSRAEVVKALMTEKALKYGAANKAVGHAEVRCRVPRPKATQLQPSLV